MSVQTRALYMRVLKWEPDQTAEEIVEELEKFDIYAWVHNSDSVNFNRDDIEVLYRGGAVFMLGQEFSVITVHPDDLERVLTEQDAT